MAIYRITWPNKHNVPVNTGLSTSTMNQSSIISCFPSQWGSTKPQEHCSVLGHCNRKGLPLTCSVIGLCCEGVECSGNTKPWLEPEIEHPVGRQGQPRGVQVHAVLFSDQKGWNKDPTLPKPHLRVSSGGKSISMEFLYNLGLRKVYSFFRLFLSVLLLHLC